MLTDRCGFGHSGAKAGVPGVTPQGEAKWSSLEVKSPLNGAALDLYRGWARAFAADGALDIIKSTSVPAITFSYFQFHKSGASEGCSCMWGPFFTSSLLGTVLPWSDFKVGITSYYDANYFRWSGPNCDGPAFTVPATINNNRWLHVTVVYDAAARTVTRYSNGEYRKSESGVVITTCNSSP